MHFIPKFEILLSGIFVLVFDFGDGLDETFEEDFEFSLFVVSDETVEVGFVFVCTGDLIDKLLSKGVKELLEHGSTIDGFKASNQVRDISATGHIVDIEFFIGNLRQILDEGGLATTSFTDEQGTLVD
jgi:hypothetical protein